MEEKNYLYLYLYFFYTLELPNVSSNKEHKEDNNRHRLLRPKKDRVVPVTVPVLNQNMITRWCFEGTMPMRALFKMADGCQSNRGVELRCTREYWMIYRGPGFLAVIWFGSFPTSSPSPDCLDWQPSQFINIVGKDDVNPAGPIFKQGEVAGNVNVNLVRHFRTYLPFSSQSYLGS